MEPSSTSSATGRTVRENLPETRLLAAPFVVLAGAGAVVLYLFPGRTDELFAWTLTPMSSAMFMGAGYAAGVVLTVLSYRRQPWAVTRTATLTIFVFVVVMTFATFLHLDRMHLDASLGTARFAAWVWVAVYVVVTPLLAVVIWRQRTAPGHDPPRGRPMGRALRTALLVHGLALVIVGLGLLVGPEAMDDVWPWPITALSGRALAAWVLAIGFASLWAVFERDLHRSKPAAITFVALGALWLVAVGRGSDEIRWERAAAWIYVAGALFAVGVGLWGWRAASAAASPPPSAASPATPGAPRPARK